MTCLSQEPRGTLWKGMHGAKLALSLREMSRAGPRPRESWSHGERDVVHPTAPNNTSPTAGEEQMQRGREPLSWLFTAHNFAR